MASISVSAGFRSVFAQHSRCGSDRFAREVRRPARSRVRLTQRAIRLLTATGVVVAISATAALFPGGASGDDGGPLSSPGESVAQRVVRVQAGDSLWQIAARTMPGEHTSEAVRAIRALNGPAASRLKPGQVLVLPGNGG